MKNSGASEDTHDIPTYSVYAFPSQEIPVAYKNYVLSKWMRTFRYSNPVMKKVQSDEFFKNYELFIENLLKKPDSRTRFAVLSEDHDVLLGFSTSREDVLDYIYVHVDYREHGIGTSLMPKGITTFTHITYVAWDIWVKNAKYKSLIFNPFA